jgi:hypothetical protein
MKKIKTYEGFFGGTHLGSDQVNTDSSVVINNTFEPDEFSNEITDDLESLKIDIMSLLEENDFDSVQLEKIKSFIVSL